MFHRDVPADFKCSKCSAHYKVVRAKAEPRSPQLASALQSLQRAACLYGWRGYPQILSHSATARSSRGYEPTPEAAMRAFAKKAGGENETIRLLGRAESS